MEAIRPQFGLPGPRDPEITEGNHKDDTQTNRIQSYGWQIYHEYVPSSRNI